MGEEDSSSRRRTEWENLRPIEPVPESGVLSCDVGRDVVSSVGATFSNQPGPLSKSSRESVR